MKLQIDTKNKTIKVEENVNIEEFLKVIKKMFPNDLWKEFTLETNTVIYYSPWITWEYKYPYHAPGTADPYPWYQYEYARRDDTVTSGIDLDTGKTFNFELVEGVYNVNAIVE